MTLGPTRLPVNLHLAGDTLHLPCLTRPMTDILNDGAWWNILPDSLHPPHRQHLLNRLANPRDPLTLSHIHRAAHTTAAHLLGVPFYTAARLIAAAQQHWTWFDAWCIQHTINPHTEQAPRLISAIHAWLRAGCTEEKDWIRIEAALYTPPPGMDDTDLPTWHRHSQQARLDDAMKRLGGSTT